MSMVNRTASAERTIVVDDVSCDTIDTTTCIYTITLDGNSIREGSFEKRNK